MKFTKANVAALKLPAGKTDHIEFDEGMPGFGVRIRESGAKYFIAQYRVGTKQGRETIGNVAKINLDDAQARAKRIFDLAASGVNPATVKAETERKVSQRIVPLIERFLAAKKSGWSEKYYGDTHRALFTYFKGLHSKSLTDISRADVATELATIQKERGDTSRNRARAALSGFFNWAIGEGECENNPVEKTNKAPENERDRALSKNELRRLWDALSDETISSDERDLVQLMVLTLQRETQIGDLKVTELNLDDTRIEFPKKRVKNKKGGKHIIPLAPIALKIVKRRKLEGRAMVFGKWDTGFANYTHLKEKIDAIVKYNEPWVFHDIRRTGKTAMSEDLDVMHEVSESILNHSKKDMDKVYNNANYLRQKLSALTAWEQFVMQAVGMNDNKQVRKAA